MTRIDFINKYSPLVKTLAASTHIFPEIVFSQAIIESSSKDGKFGDNYNAVQGNNFFGIKAGAGWHGATITNPNVKSESNIFRAYDSPKDSISDYFRFLVSNSRYAKAGVFSAETWQEQAEALANAGYAGKGNEAHYISLIKQIGGTVSKLLGKVVNVVTKHKPESVLVGLGIIAAITLAYGSRK